MTFALTLVGYFVSGYVLSLFYEFRRRKAQAACIQRRVEDGNSELRAEFVCTKGYYGEEPHWHSEPSTLWVAFAGWPVYLVILIGIFVWTVASSIAIVINPSKVVDKGEKVVQEIEKRREAREEAKKMATLVKGKGEVDG